MQSKNSYVRQSFKPPGCYFIVEWMLATAGGFALSLSILVVGERPDLGFWHGIRGVVGWCQGIVLLRYRLAGEWWFLANAIAWVGTCWCESNRCCRLAGSPKFAQFAFSGELWHARRTSDWCAGGIFAVVGF